MDLTQSEPTPSAPWLLRTGAAIARLIAVMLLLPIACHPAGGALVRLNGEVLPRSVILTRIYPLIVALGIGTFVVAGGLRRGRSWSRPCMALWLLLSPLLLLLVSASLGGPIRPMLLPTIVAVLPVAGTTLAYLYYNPGVTRYFKHAALRDAQARVGAQRSEEAEAWLRKPKRPTHGA